MQPDQHTPQVVVYPTPGCLCLNTKSIVLHIHAEDPDPGSSDGLGSWYSSASPGPEGTEQDVAPVTRFQPCCGSLHAAAEAEGVYLNDAAPARYLRLRVQPHSGVFRRADHHVRNPAVPVHNRLVTVRLAGCLVPGHGRLPDTDWRRAGALPGLRHRHLKHARAARGGSAFGVRASVQRPSRSTCLPASPRKDEPHHRCAAKRSPPPDFTERVRRSGSLKRM